MGLSGISKSQVSKLCKDIDERVNAFLDRPIDGEWPYLWLDATYPENASTPQAPRKMALPSCLAGRARSDSGRHRHRPSSNMSAGVPSSPWHTA